MASRVEPPRSPGLSPPRRKNAAGQRETQLARLLNERPACFSFERASRIVAKAANRDPGFSLKVVAARNRRGQLRSQRQALAEQAGQATERAAIAALREKRAAARDAANAQLSQQLSRQAAMVALRCDHAMPRREARECRESLEAMQLAVAAHGRAAIRGELELERGTAALQQSKLERDLRLERLVFEEGLASAGYIQLQQLQRAKVAGRVVLAATLWCERARLSRLRRTLREESLRATSAERKQTELQAQLRAVSRAAATIAAGESPGRKGDATKTDVLRRALREAEQGRIAEKEARLTAEVEAQARAAAAAAAEARAEECIRDLDAASARMEALLAELEEQRTSAQAAATEMRRESIRADQADVKAERAVELRKAAEQRTMDLEVRLGGGGGDARDAGLGPSGGDAGGADGADSAAGDEASSEAQGLERLQMQDRLEVEIQLRTRAEQQAHALQKQVWELKRDVAALGSRAGGAPAAAPAAAPAPAAPARRAPAHRKPPALLAPPTLLSKQAGGRRAGGRTGRRTGGSAGRDGDDERSASEEGEEEYAEEDEGDEEIGAEVEEEDAEEEDEDEDEEEGGEEEAEGGGGEGGASRAMKAWHAPASGQQSGHRALMSASRPPSAVSRRLTQPRAPHVSVNGQPGLGCENRVPNAYGGKRPPAGKGPDLERLHVQLRLLREQQVEAGGVVRALEAKLLKKQREAANLSSALQSCLLAAKPAPHGTARGAQGAPALAEVSKSKGFELVQVVLDTAAPHVPPGQRLADRDPLDVLDGKPTEAPPLPGPQQLVVRLRGKVYSLREIGRGKGDDDELAQRIRSVLALAAPEPEPAPVQQAHRAPPPVPERKRVAGSDRHYYDQAILTSRPQSRPGSGFARLARPQSAQAAFRHGAGAKPLILREGSTRARA